MISRLPAHIVVGVDNTPAGDAAVRYAATEAARTGCILRLVHATLGYDDTTPRRPALDAGSLKNYGLGLLEQAADLAHACAPGLQLETRLISGGVVSTLVDCSADAALLVIGAERRTALGHIWTGDVIAGAVARATCPVVVVPPDWEPNEEHLRIVVGLKSVEGAADLLTAAFVQAHERAAEVVVLHAWQGLSGYDEIAEDRNDVADYARRLTALVEESVTGLRDAYPDVKVRVKIVHGQPAYTLVEASSAADALLISRPKHGTRVHHLGLVGRAVLHQANCPVEVIAPSVT